MLLIFIPHQILECLEYNFYREEVGEVREKEGIERGEKVERVRGGRRQEGKHTL